MGKKDKKGSKAKDKAKSKKAAEIKEKEAAKKLSGTFGGKNVSYTAKAATQVFEVNDTKAQFFYVSYTEDEADPAERPILFCFNGGPGSSTVWLHLGLFGPKRFELDDEGFKSGMQGRLIENEHSILDVADVVCVDALGTGFSKIPDKEKEDDFSHFRHDIDAFSKFIIHYLNRNGRWASPKYLAGESYGTLRAAALAHNLFAAHGVEFNGIILISSILNYQTVAVEYRGKTPTQPMFLYHPGNDLPAALYLPTFAATAWYHGALAPEYQEMPLRELLDEVEDFALGDYWSALAKGDLIDDATRKSVIERMSSYTGLSSDYIDQYDMRVSIIRFCKELLRSRRRTVGRIDSRYTGIDRVPAGDNIEADPSMDATGGVATSTLNHYLREEIGFKSDDIYNIMSMRVNEKWDYEDFKNRYVDTSESLRAVLSRSRGTKVLVANGYYDLATPHFATEYTFSHMGLDPEVRKNVEMKYYEAGHMMYVHKPSLEKMSADLRDFVESTR
ncbi:MAG: alpha/beta fold hydrolase [Acidimicrobiia bacterium]|nr:alpha/beta fold hydrolase [Acidimicrobiia bacterium]